MPDNKRVVVGLIIAIVFAVFALLYVHSLMMTPKSPNPSIGLKSISKPLEDKRIARMYIVDGEPPALNGVFYDDSSPPKRLDLNIDRSEMAKATTVTDGGNGGEVIVTYSKGKVPDPMPVIPNNIETHMLSVTRDSLLQITDAAGVVYWRYGTPSPGNAYQHKVKIGKVANGIELAYKMSETADWVTSASLRINGNPSNVNIDLDDKGELTISGPSIPPMVFNKLNESYILPGEFISSDDLRYIYRSNMVYDPVESEKVSETITRMIDHDYNPDTPDIEFTENIGKRIYKSDTSDVGFVPTYLKVEPSGLIKIVRGDKFTVVNSDLPESSRLDPPYRLGITQTETANSLELMNRHNQVVWKYKNSFPVSQNKIVGLVVSNGALQMFSNKLPIEDIARIN